tara:strand:- start:506 stop:652 length:147 start_codon:yes stop_codon:yes gene_type:complete
VVVVVLDPMQIFDQKVPSFWRIAQQAPDFIERAQTYAASTVLAANFPA